MLLMTALLSGGVQESGDAEIGLDELFEELCRSGAAHETLVPRPTRRLAPRGSPLKRIGQAPKHHLADPAFAARLLKLTPSRLRIEAQRHASIIGQLWESFVAMHIRVFAEPHMADVSHLRTQGGDHAVDLIVESGEGDLLAIEVRLNAPVDAADVKHLSWLREHLPNRRIQAAVITSTQHAYTRPDGIHVVPLALLGA